MQKVNVLLASAAAAAALVLSIAPAYAAKCNPPGGFNAFIAEFKKEATGKGISSGSSWWLFAGLVVAGLLIRRHSPVVALALVATGTFGSWSVKKVGAGGSWLSATSNANEDALSFVSLDSTKRKLQFGALA